MGKSNKVPSKNKSVIGIAVVLVVVAGVLSVKYFKDVINLSGRKASEAKLKGPQNAPIQVIEFLDFQCPACANGVKILKKQMETHPQLIHLQLKYFPLTNVHQHSLLAARYAECSARQDKFWGFSDEVFARQEQWKNLFDAHGAFEQIAKDIGLNPTLLESCLRDEKLEEPINKNKEEGRALGVQSTPTYFINNQMVVGTKNLEIELEKLISAETTH